MKMIVANCSFFLSPSKMCPRSFFCWVFYYCVLLSIMISIVCCNSTAAAATTTIIATYYQLPILWQFLLVLLSLMRRLKQLLLSTEWLSCVKWISGARWTARVNELTFALMWLRLWVCRLLWMYMQWICPLRSNFQPYRTAWANSLNSRWILRHPNSRMRIIIIHKNISFDCVDELTTQKLIIRNSLLLFF